MDESIPVDGEFRTAPAFYRHAELAQQILAYIDEQLPTENCVLKTESNASMNTKHVIYY